MYNLLPIFFNKKLHYNIILYYYIIAVIIFRSKELIKLKFINFLFFFK